MWENKFKLHSAPKESFACYIAIMFIAISVLTLLYQEQPYPPHQTQLTLYTTKRSILKNILQEK